MFDIRFEDKEENATPMLRKEAEDLASFLASYHWGVKGAYATIAKGHCGIILRKYVVKYPLYGGNGYRYIRIDGFGVRM